MSTPPSSSAVQELIDLLEKDILANLGNPDQKRANSILAVNLKLALAIEKDNQIILEKINLLDQRGALPKEPGDGITRGV